MGAQLICLLDTNVLSQRKAKRPDETAVQFLNELPQEKAFISVIALMEIRAGIEKLKPDSNNRKKLEKWLTEVIPNQYAGRILPVTSEIADEAGRMLTAERTAARTPDLADLLIASTAKAYGMYVATLNRKHFELLGVKLVDV